ncbi:hypothetical protein GRI39_09490 [Altererythrobacter indicus]|uniref:Lipoprotein n=1 Tax=Altericroceibacterium indicum TaxID=374177 RepID=A0A845A9T0_9SPHN|nr:hypothetical protein [Altericroceibacterium indicum]MXP26267.1 hypothetical protein [Altericroceibacterium indicum]
MRLFLVIPCAALALAACSSQQPASDETDQVAAELDSSTPEPVVSDEDDVDTTAPLSSDALQERDNPRRVLAYISQAVAQHRLADAALAWRSEAEMTGALLEEQIGDYPDVKISFGDGETEGAAGTLYYTVPVALTADSGKMNRKGSITLSRVNDVPGATEEQLDWRVRQLTFDK